MIFEFVELFVGGGMLVLLLYLLFVDVFVGWDLVISLIEIVDFLVYVGWCYFLIVDFDILIGDW